MKDPLNRSYSDYWSPMEAIPASNDGISFIDIDKINLTLSTLTGRGYGKE
jgi:hypothetical protein